MGSTIETQWPSYDLNSIPEYMTAIGVLCVNFNNLENKLLWLFKLYCDAPADVTAFVFERFTSKETKLTFLEFLLKRRKSLNPKLRATIQQFSRAYNICAKNRNLLIHSSVSAYLAVDGAIMLSRRAKSHGKERRLDFDLATIRQAADEMHAWNGFGDDLISYVLRKKRARQKTRPGLKLVGLTTLPQALSQPIDLENLFLDPSR